MSNTGSKNYLGALADPDHPANRAIGFVDRHTLVSASIAAVTIAIICSALASITTGSVSDLMSMATMLAVLGIVICAGVGAYRIWDKMQSKKAPVYQ